MKPILLLATLSVVACTQQTQYPMTRQDNTTDNYFGHTIADPYRWLENDTSAETMQWVKAQNNLTRTYLDAIPFRQQISDRLKQLWHYERKSAPYKKGDYYFYSKNDGLQNQAIYYRTKSLNEEGEIILDPNTLSDNGTIALAEFSVSPDGHYLGYGIARNGSDWNEYYVRNLDTKEDLPDHLKWIKFSVIEWFNDGFFYSRYPQPTEGNELTAENLDNAVYYHKLNTPQSADKLIFSDPINNQRSFVAGVTDDNEMLVINVTESTTGNALYTLDLTNPKAKIQRTIDTYDKDNISIGHHNNKLLVQTNNNAPHYRIVAIDVNNPSPENWTTIVPETDDVIEYAEYGNNHIYINYMHNAHSKLVVADIETNKIEEVPMPAIGDANAFRPSKGEDVVFFTLSSYVSPMQTYAYSTAKNEVSKVDGWGAKVNFPFSEYETEQIFYTSTDGTQIPMFITHKKGIELNGNNPVWLYGYGGFNISLTPAFEIRRLLWLEQGGIYAVANIRGGGEYGETWHLAGTIMNKQNVFNDFISAAHYLIDKKYTNPSLIVCQGGSNGGLLIGATINQAPELFRVAIPQVGVMDMLRYHKFTIGRYWATDYGTSDDSEQMFQYLQSYSPLHNIANLNYPSVLVTTGDHDDRVVPAHSFKYVATLQEKYKGNRPMLIRIESQAGHGAGKPTTKVIEEWTDIYAFAFNELGIKYNE